MFKRCKVVMLPTNEKSKLFITNNHLSLLNYEQSNLGESYNQHLYILSDDEIKDGDWFLDTGMDNKPLSSGPWQLKGISSEIGAPTDAKKIIATTDRSLTLETYDSSDEGSSCGKMYLPKPSDSFIKKYIEEYNKGNQISDILVEYAHITDFAYQDEYQLKVSSDNTITIRKVKDSWNREEMRQLAIYFKAIGGNEKDNCWLSHHDDMFKNYIYKL